MNDSDITSEQTASPVRGGVLLLDDDTELKDVIKDYLIECGYSVTLARNGVEGIRRVLDEDFSVILCDMMMPTLSGKMFYGALQRVSPHLCHRLVFMTGHRNDPEINAFIAGVDGEVLMKPFPMADLLATIHRLESRHGHAPPPPVAAPAVPVVPVAPAAPAAVSAPAPVAVPPSLSAPGNESMPLVRVSRSVVSLARIPVAEAPVRPVLPATPRTSSAPMTPVPNFASTEDEAEEEPSYFKPILAALILLLLGGALFQTWASHLRESIALAEGDLQVLEADWTITSVQLPETEQKRLEIQQRLDLPVLLERDAQVAGWEPVLRAVLAASGPKMQFEEIQGRGIPADPDARELHLKGSAVGSSPHMLADRFCQVLHEGLSAQFPGAVSVRLDKLEDVTKMTVEAPQPKASFAITAFVRMKEPKNGD